jgi:hypothetical protein
LTSSNASVVEGIVNLLLRDDSASLAEQSSQLNGLRCFFSQTRMIEVTVGGKII